MPNSKRKAKATVNQKAKKKVESGGDSGSQGKSDSESVLAVMEQLDFVSELLVNWRDSLAYQLGATVTKDELDETFVQLFLKDRRVYPGEGEGRADSSRKRRRLSDNAEDPLKEGQREVLEDFLAVVRNTKNYAKLSSNEMAAFNKVMDEAMLKWALFRRVNMVNSEPQDHEINLAY